MAFGGGFVLVFKVDRVQYAYRLLIVSWCHSVHAIIFAEVVCIVENGASGAQPARSRASSKISARLKGLPPALHRQQAFLAAKQFELEIFV